MVTIPEALFVLYPAAVPLRDYSVSRTLDGIETITMWNATLLGPQPTQVQLDAVTQAQVDTARATKERSTLVGLLSVSDHPAQLMKALMLTILDEFNLHALKINALFDAIDAATTLANLKSAVAGIADYPPRTASQLITSMTNKINAGSVD